MSKKVVGELKFLFIHCSDTVGGRHYDKKDIIHWHTSPKSEGGFGWSRPGYRSAVLIDGTIQKIMEANLDSLVQSNEMTWGVRGQNAVSHHVVYIGGKDENGVRRDTRTEEQKESLKQIVLFYIEKVNPDIVVKGHYQADKGKKCPSFDVPKWLREIGVDEKNISDSDPGGYKSYFEEVNG
jgi:hypothetical protein